MKFWLWWNTEYQAEVHISSAFTFRVIVLGTYRLKYVAAISAKLGAMKQDWFVIPKYTYVDSVWDSDRGRYVDIPDKSLGSGIGIAWAVKLLEKEVSDDE